MGSEQPRWQAVRVRYPEDRSLLIRARDSFYQPGEDNYVDWLCGGNPAGTPYCYMAMDGDTIAGQYMVVPIRLAVGGNLVSGCLSLDTFTNEEYRKQGIFVTLAERVYDDAEQDGMKFTLGLPNNNSRPGFLKNLRFTEPVSYSLNVLPLPLRKVASSSSARRAATGWRRIGTATHRKLRIRTADVLDVDWCDALWEGLRPLTRWGQWKDGQWMDWRFCRNPKFSYRFILAEDSAGNPAGYLVWCFDPHKLDSASGAWVMDIDGLGLNIRLAMMRYLVAEISAEVDWIKSMHSPLSRYGRALTLSGFIPRRQRSLIFRPLGQGLSGLPDFGGRATDMSTALADFL
jgi:hypothetical protein